MGCFAAHIVDVVDRRNGYVVEVKVNTQSGSQEGLTVPILKLDARSHDNFEVVAWMNKKAPADNGVRMLTYSCINERPHADALLPCGQSIFEVAAYGEVAMPMYGCVSDKQGGMSVRMMRVRMVIAPGGEGGDRE